MRPRPTRPGEPGPRLAVMGAFAFPYHQGSQLYLAGQARALADAGARPSILCYGSGIGDGPHGIQRISPPAAFAPRALGSGLHWGKPVADAALLTAGLGAARKARRSGQPFDFVLAHNAEAAAIALASRRSFRAPLVYVAHTLWRQELSAYLPSAWKARAEKLGGRIDRFVARHADGIIALSEETQSALGTVASGPVALIPPGLEAGSPPAPEQIAEVCRDRGLSPAGYDLYSGNLDRYQDLALLDEAARLGPASSKPLVVASHADPAERKESTDPGMQPGGVRRIRVRDFAEMRILIHGASCLVAPRRRVGGFPVKLLNYMEAGLPIVAVAGAAPGLVDGESAWLMEAREGAGGLARARAELASNPGMRDRLGAGARAHLAARHSWPRLAAQTLDYLATLGSSGRRRA